MPDTAMPSPKTPALRPAAVVIVALLVGLGPTMDGGGPGSPGAAAQAAPAASGGELDNTDIDRAIASISGLGAFFGRLADNDPNRLAAKFWSGLEAYYVQAGARLADLRERGRVRIGVFPDQVASRAQGGTIVVDRTLGGEWRSEFVRSTRRSGGDDWGYISLLSSALLDGLAHLEPERTWAWFEMHRSRSNLAKPTGGDHSSSLSLVRFWHIKDKYLWLSMPAGAGIDRQAQRRNAGRRVHLFSEVTAAIGAIERDLGAGWSERLDADWRDYDRMVRQFRVNRAWLTSPPVPPPAARPAAKVPTRPAALPPKPRAKPRIPALAPEPAPSGQAAAGSREGLTAALRTSREEVARLKQETARLADVLDASRQEAAAGQARLRAEQAVSREVLAALKEDMEAERSAARQGFEDLETRLTRALETARREAETLAEGLRAELGESERTVAALRDRLDREREASRREITRLESDLAERLGAAQAEAAHAEERLGADLTASQRKEADLRAELAASRAAAREEIGRLEERLARESQKARDIEAFRQAQSETAPAPAQGEIREPGQPGQQLALLPGLPARHDTWLWIAALGALAVAALALAWAAAGLLHRRRTAALGATAGGPGFRLASGGIGQAAAARLAGVTGATGGDEGLPRGPADPETGRPTPQSLVEALRQGDLALFRERFGRMTDLSEDQLGRILSDPSGEDLAIVCRALAMDKLVLASIFLLSHKTRPGGLEVKPEDLSSAMAHFDRMTRDAAEQVLETWRGNPGLPGSVEELHDKGRAEGEEPKSQ